MAHKLKVRNKLKVHVKGEFKDEDGSTVPFDFHLHCKRKSQEEVSELTGGRSGKLIKEFLKESTEGWDDDMQDEHGTPLPFNAENLDLVLNQFPGMALVCFQSYLHDCAAVAKN